jgi:hypothetical protein
MLMLIVVIVIAIIPAVVIIYTCHGDALRMEVMGWH